MNTRLANDVLGSRCVLMLYACCLQGSCPSLESCKLSRCGKLQTQPSWNPDKALHYAEHLGNNIEGHNSFMKAIERKDVEAANNYLRAMMISASCTSGMGKFLPCAFIRRIKGWQLEPERLFGLVMYAGEREGFFTLFEGR